ELEGFAADLVLGDAENGALGRVEQLLCGELIRITVADDFGCALDQLPIDRLFLDDSRVVLSIGGMRDTLADLGQHVVAADLFKLIAELEFLGESDRVDSFSLVVE